MGAHAKPIDAVEVYELLVILGSQRAVAKRIGVCEATLTRRGQVDPAVGVALLEGRTRYRERTYPPGSRTGYVQGCRCDACTTANSDDVRRRAAERSQRQEQAIHGKASTYQNWKCRCDPCKAAHSANLKQRYADGKR
jgi:hypothetical protein